MAHRLNTIAVALVLIAQAVLALSVPPVVCATEGEPPRIQAAHTASSCDDHGCPDDPGNCTDTPITTVMPSKHAQAAPTPDCLDACPMAPVYVLPELDALVLVSISRGEAYVSLRYRPPDPLETIRLLI